MIFLGGITHVKCKIGLWFLSTALPFINIIQYMYVPSLIPITFELSKIWTGQATILASIMKNKWLRGMTQ